MPMKRKAYQARRAAAKDDTDLIRLAVDDTTGTNHMCDGTPLAELGVEPWPGLPVSQVLLSQTGAMRALIHSGEMEIVERPKSGGRPGVTRYLRRTATTKGKVEDLEPGNVFSVDGGQTWHTCAVVLFGNVAVYATGDRDPDTAPTIRVDADRDADCIIRGAAR
jgi:hypothetical protein